MKFSDCLSAMVDGKVAVKGGVRRRAVVICGIYINIEQLEDGGGRWFDKRVYDVNFDEDGWEIEVEPKEVCGITFTCRTDDAGVEVWVSDERGLRLTRNPGCDWLCETCFDGPKLWKWGATAEEAVEQLLQAAKEAARMAARVLGTAEVSK